MWLREILQSNLLLGLCLSVSSLLLIFSFYLNVKKINFLTALFFLVLLFYQFKTTNFLADYKLTPYEIDLQIQRMNQYPPKLARLGYILEFKKEMLIFNKWQNVFFDIFDIKLYFGNYFSYWLIPFFFIGLFAFISSGKKFLQIQFGVAVVFLSFLGKNGNFGPFLFFPFFVLFIFIGFLKLFKLVKK